MFILWLVVIVALLDGVQMGQNMALSLPHFCICEKTNSMKVIPRRMCIYSSSSGSEYMSDCLSQVDKVFNMCHRNVVRCFHLKFDPESKTNASESSALIFVPDKRNPARRFVFVRKNSTNPLDDQYFKKFDIMTKVFPKLFKKQQELLDLPSLISEFEEAKNKSKKTNFHLLISKKGSSSFLTTSEARKLTTKLKKSGVLMSTAIIDLVFAFNGSEMSFFDEDFWNLVKDEFEIKEDLQVFPAEVLDYQEYEDKNGRPKDKVSRVVEDLKAIPLEGALDSQEHEDENGGRKVQVSHVKETEEKTDKRGHAFLKGKRNFSNIERNRGKNGRVGGRTKYLRKKKPELIFLISMGTDLPMNKSELGLKNTTGGGEKSDAEQDSKSPPVDEIRRDHVLVGDSNSSENEISVDAFKSRNSVYDQPRSLGRKLLQFKKDDSKGLRFIEDNIEIESRPKRAFFPHNDWCSIPKTTLHGNLRCTVWSYKKECQLTCLPGYTLKKKSKAKLCCNRKEKKWKPALTPCEAKSGNNIFADKIDEEDPEEEIYDVDKEDYETEDYDSHDIYGRTEVTSYTFGPGDVYDDNEEPSEMQGRDSEDYFYYEENPAEDREDDEYEMSYTYYEDD